MEKSIKILLIMPFFYPHKGGSEKYAEELHTHLIQNHRDISVDVLCYKTNNAPKYERYREMRIFRVPCITIIKDKFVLPNWLRLLPMLRHLKNNKYDFVNTHVRFFDTTWWVWIYAKVIGAKSIFTGHVPGHPVHHTVLVQEIAKFVDNTWGRESVARYDLITFANKATKAFFEREWGFTKDSRLIYIGVDTLKFRPNQQKPIRDVPKTNLHLSSQHTLFTYVGRLIETKGVLYLYDAIKQLSKQLPSEMFKDMYFVFAGPGELEEKLKNQIIADHLEKNVKVTGGLNYEEVGELMSYSDIFVNPSSHDEGLPNTLFEAGASKCLVIATKSGGIPELIEQDKTGILISQRNIAELKRSIKWAMENKETRLKLAENLYERILLHHTWKTSSDKYYEYLTENLPLRALK